MRKLSLFTVLFTALLCLSISTASAQKLYWTASGLFGPFDIKGLIPSYPESRDIKIPVNMWVLDHPKGLVVFDTGNNVAISDGQCKTHWAAGMCDFIKPSQTRDDVIDKHNSKSSVTKSMTSKSLSPRTPTSITLATLRCSPRPFTSSRKKNSTRHGGRKKFQRGGAHVMADYDDARDFNYLELNGDYDLFGDGSVIVLSTPGHTMGHQSIKVQLPETGTVILSKTPSGWRKIWKAIRRASTTACWITPTQSIASK